MAEITGRPKIELQVVFTLSEEEARALDAMVGYGDDAFIKVFYEKLGASCMRDHEAGLRSFLLSARREIPRHLRRADEARKVFNGTHTAVEVKRPEGLP